MAQFSMNNFFIFKNCHSILQTMLYMLITNNANTFGQLSNNEFRNAYQQQKQHYNTAVFFRMAFLSQGRL